MCVFAFPGVMAMSRERVGLVASHPGAPLELWDAFDTNCINFINMMDLHYIYICGSGFNLVLTL